ncbi:unnamed protein product [Ixodes hexagonus]
MGGGDCAKVEMASFLVAEFSDILDWRPMLFQEPIIAQRACALCGILYRKTVRLPCVHALCVKCHAQRVDEGSTCPVDQEPFCEDDVELLELSLKYILNRKAACWNAPKGCSFIGPAASLLDHYKGCDFGVMSCCLCHSSVLRSNILEHFENGCDIHQATYGPADDHTRQDLKDVSRACLEMKRAMGKISEDLISLQTSLNRCSEDVRPEAARCKDQWKAEASKLTEQLSELSTVCTTGFAEELKVLQVAVADHKEHLSKELVLQTGEVTVSSDNVYKNLPSHCRPKTAHWYIEHWADLKQQALKGYAVQTSVVKTIHGYSVSQLITLTQGDTQTRFGHYLVLHPGEHDSQLDWPFRNAYTVGAIHPKDQSNVISFKVNTGWYEDQASFQRPKEKSNKGFGRPFLTTAERLEEDGFIQNDKLHVFLEIEP